jgi:hypothetical protein
MVGDGKSLGLLMGDWDGRIEDVYVQERI